jgi:hypothetical protein
MDENMSITDNIDYQGMKLINIPISSKATFYSSPKIWLDS